MKRAIAVVVLSTFIFGIVPVRALAQSARPKPKVYEILLDTAAAGHMLKVIRTQQDLAAIEVADDDTRSVMAGALATGTVAIVTTQQPIISARYRWYGTPWLALGSTYLDFGANQQGFHFNAGHENPNQSEQDLSDDVVAIGLALQQLGNTIAAKPIGDAKAQAAAKALGVAIASLGLAITMFGLGMKLALATGAPGARSGSVDTDNDPEDDGPPGTVTIPDLGQQGAGIGPAGPDGSAPGGPGPSGGGGSTGDSGVGDE